MPQTVMPDYELITAAVAMVTSVYYVGTTNANVCDKSGLLGSSHTHMTVAAHLAPHLPARTWWQRTWRWTRAIAAQLLWFVALVTIGLSCWAALQDVRQRKFEDIVQTVAAASLLIWPALAAHGPGLWAQLLAQWFRMAAPNLGLVRLGRTLPQHSLLRGRQVH